jgi:hypothetical protein
MYSVPLQPTQFWFEDRKSGVNFNAKRNQIDQIVNAGDSFVSLLQLCFQLFFCRLLGVKTNCVVIRPEASVVFALGG